MLLKKKTDRQWERLGSTDPYFGVLSDSRFLSQRITETDKHDFFRSGEDHVEYLFSLIEKRLQRPLVARRALDFGCGVGRIVIPLSRRSDFVVGVDVSPSMLAEAKRNCDEAGIGNVELVLSDGNWVNSSDHFDLLHSYLVFQHIPNREGFKILSRILRLAAESAVFVAQFIYLDAATKSRKIVNRAQATLPFVHWLANKYRNRPWNFPHMEMNPYDMNVVVSMLSDNGFCEVTFLTTPSRGGDIANRYHGATVLAYKGHRLLEP